MSDTPRKRRPVPWSRPEPGELEEIMDYLFDELPAQVRSRWGGDPDEFLEGIRVAMSWRDSDEETR